MGRHEIGALAQRLYRVPRDTEAVRIEWDRVTHLDFRGLSDLASAIRALNERGVRVRCTGLSPYLVAILRFALSLDEIELFDVAHPNQWAGDLSVVPAFRLSKN